MPYKKIVQDIFNELQKNIYSQKFRKNYFAEDCTNFTRARCMPFQELVAFLFQRSAYSLDIKLVPLTKQQIFT